MIFVGSEVQNLNYYVVNGRATQKKIEPELTYDTFVNLALVWNQYCWCSVSSCQCFIPGLNQKVLAASCRGVAAGFWFPDNWGFDFMFL